MSIPFSHQHIEKTTPDDIQEESNERYETENKNEVIESLTNPDFNLHNISEHHEDLASLVRVTATSLSNVHKEALRAACRQNSELVGDMFVKAAGAVHPDKDEIDTNHTVLYKRDHFTKNLLSKSMEQQRLLFKIGSTGMKARKEKFMRDIAEETLNQISQAAGTIIGNICCDTRNTASRQGWVADGGAKLLISDTITSLKHRLIAIEEKNNQLLEMGCSALQSSCEARIEEAAKHSHLEIAFIEKNLDFERLKGELAAAYKVSETYDSQLTNLLVVCNKLAEETDALRDLPEKLAEEKRLNFLLESHLKSVNEISVAVLKERFEKYSRERNERKSQISSVETTYPSKDLQKVSPDLFALKLLQHKKISISELVADWENKYDTVTQLQSTIQSLNEEKANTARLLSQAITALAEERHRRTTTEKWCQQQCLQSSPRATHCVVSSDSLEGNNNAHKNLHLLYSDAQNEIVALKCRLVDATNENRFLKDQTQTLKEEVSRLESEAKHSELIQAVSIARKQFSLDQQRLQMELGDALGKLNQAEAVINDITDRGNASQEALLEAERSNENLITKLAEAENRHIQLLGKIRQLEGEAVEQAADASTFALQTAQEQHYSQGVPTGATATDENAPIQKESIDLGTCGFQYDRGDGSKSDDFIRICQSSLDEMCNAVITLWQQFTATMASRTSESSNSTISPSAFHTDAGTDVVDIGEGQYRRAMEYMQNSLSKLLRVIIAQAKINDEIQREINDSLLLDMNTYRSMGEDLARYMKERDDLAIKVDKYENIISRHGLQATESLLLESSTASSSALRKIDYARELASEATNTQSENTGKMIVNAEEIATLRQELDCATTENISMRSVVKELEMKVSFLTSQQASKSIALEACQAELSLYQDRLAAVREENVSLQRSLNSANKSDEHIQKVIETLRKENRLTHMPSESESYSSRNKSPLYNVIKEKSHETDIVEDTRAMSPKGQHLVHITKCDVAYENDSDQLIQSIDIYPSVERIICEGDEESSEEEECVNPGTTGGPRFVVRVASDDGNRKTDIVFSEEREDEDDDNCDDEIAVNMANEVENEEYNYYHDDDNDNGVEVGVGSVGESEVLLSNSLTSFTDQVRLIRNTFQTIEAALTVNDASTTYPNIPDKECEINKQVECGEKRIENFAEDDDEGGRSETDRAAEILDTHLENLERLSPLAGQSGITNNNPTTTLTNMLVKAQETIISTFSIVASGQTPTPDVLEQTTTPSVASPSDTTTIFSLPSLFQAGREIRDALEKCDKHNTAMNLTPEASPAYFQLEAEKRALEEQTKKAKPLVNILLDQKQGLERQVLALTQKLAAQEKEVESLKINNTVTDDDVPTSVSVLPSQGTQNQPTQPQLQKQQVTHSSNNPQYAPKRGVPPKAIPSKTEPLITTPSSGTMLSSTTTHGAERNPVITSPIQNQPKTHKTPHDSLSPKGPNEKKHPPKSFKMTKKSKDNVIPPPLTQPKKQPFFNVGTPSQLQKEPMKQNTSIFGSKAPQQQPPPLARPSAFGVLPMMAPVVNPLGGPSNIIPSSAVFAFSSPGDNVNTVHSSGTAQAITNLSSPLIGTFGSAVGTTPTSIEIDQQQRVITSQTHFGIQQHPLLSTSTTPHAVQRQQAQPPRLISEQQTQQQITTAEAVSAPKITVGAQLGKGAAAAVAALRARKAGQK